MSTTTDNTQVNGAFALPGGGTATPNPDGSFTVQGNSGLPDGVYEPVSPDAPGAFQVTDTGTQYDGHYFAPRS